MSVKLGEMLVQGGTLNQEQLEQVLSAQSIYGGRLGTNLVEMGFLSEDDLELLLNEKLGVPCVNACSLESIPNSVLSTLPREMVLRLQALPIALEGRRLTVAMADPSNFSAIDEIGFFTGLVIVPRVCSELRLSMALERFFRIKRALHFIPVEGGVRTRMVKQTREQAGLQGVHPCETRGAGADSHAAEAQPGRETGPATLPRSAPPPGPAVDSRAAGSGSASAAAANPLALLAIRLAAVERESEVVALAMSYLKKEFHRAAFLSLKRDSIVGVHAVADGADIPEFAGRLLEREGATLLQGILEQRSPYLGKFPEGGIEAEILARIGGAPGSVALLLPVQVSGIGVAFLLGDDSRGRLIHGLPELQRLAAKAGLAFEMLAARKRIGQV